MSPRKATSTKVFSQCEDLRSLSPAAFPGHPRFIPETTASAYAAATVYAAPRESQARLAAVEHITSGERNVAARHCIGGASAKRASRRTAAATLPVRPYAPHSPSPPGGRGRPGKKGVENAMGERARCTEGRSSHFWHDFWPRSCTSLGTGDATKMRKKQRTK